LVVLEALRLAVNLLDEVSLLSASAAASRVPPPAGEKRRLSARVGLGRF